jgi:hypothetical protein
MSFEAPAHRPEDFDTPDIILTEQEIAEFAEVSDRIWARILEEINFSQ